MRRKRRRCSDDRDALTVADIVQTLEVDTPEGLGRFHYTIADEVRSVLILGHGAGGAIDAIDLSVLASRLPAEGTTVARFEQPWRVAGKQATGPPAKLDSAWRAAVPQLLTDERILPTGDVPVPVFVGGRSAGARVACRTAPQFDADVSALLGRVVGIAGVVCCAFPLHPPGRPERSRADELLSAGLPRLVLQGERDTFGGADEVAGVIPDDESIRLVRVPQADHSMRVPRTAVTTPADVRDLIADTVAEFCSPR